MIKALVLEAIDFWFEFLLWVGLICVKMKIYNSIEYAVLER